MPTAAPHRPVLDPRQQRVLGALLEKERTVPATYPLSLNALRTACNQTTSRDPVTDYAEAELELCARELKEAGLLRIVWAGKGSRTLKYHQLLAEAFDLADDERAVLTVLLLRGGQSAGELRTRTERLHAFDDRADVEEVLRRLAARDLPLVAQMQRQPGQHDPRWIHLLGPVPSGAPMAPAEDSGAALGAAGSAVDREVVLADGARARDERVRVSYDAVAEAYADHFGEELTGKPFDRWLLERVAELAGSAPVADVGCGPGHLAAFLADAGADVTGVDLSERMVQRARADFPDLAFQVGDALALLRPPHASGWGAIVAWYSLIHLAGSELPGAVAALARTLDPGGFVALALHAGDEVRHRSSWWDRDVDLDVVLHDPREVRQAVESAGLQVAEWYVRGPMPDEESQTERLYVLARRPRP